MTITIRGTKISWNRPRGYRYVGPRSGLCPNLRFTHTDIRVLILALIPVF